MSNWFTEESLANATEEVRIKKAHNIEDECEHVQNHPEMLYVISRENDSFGIVGEYGMCQSCYRQMKENINNEKVICHDCHQTVNKGDTISWKWYDFYAPQGDEPMIICNHCRTLPKHKQRVIKDREEYEEEIEYLRRH